MKTMHTVKLPLTSSQVTFPCMYIWKPQTKARVNNNIPKEPIAFMNCPEASSSLKFFTAEFTHFLRMLRRVWGGGSRKVWVMLGGRMTISYTLVWLSSQTGFIHGDLFSGQSWHFLIFHGMAKYLTSLTGESCHKTHEGHFCFLAALV